ncbi:MAG: VWA domain-containing protein [Isosphaeraceae bacterium]
MLRKVKIKRGNGKPDAAPVLDAAPLEEEASTLDDIVAELEPKRHVPLTPKVLVVAVIDLSGSMTNSGAAKLALKAGTAVLDEGRKDVLFRQNVEYAVIGYGSNAVVLRHFGPFQPDGDGEIWEDANAVGPDGTMSAAALLLAFQLLDSRKAELAELGVPCKAKFCVLLTDGRATDSDHAYADACLKRVQRERADKFFKVFGVAVGGAVDFAKLEQLVGQPVALDGLKFSQFWNWIRQSAVQASRTKMGEAFELPNPFASPGNQETGFAKDPRWIEGMGPKS